MYGNQHPNGVPSVVSPRGMLPFGDDPAGNLYLVKISPGDSYGSIFFWDHENEADLEEQPNFDNIHFISQTFDNFLNELHY
ncbi:hypothetical protein GJ700_30160 [Duganella sp. FT92W]|uniref:Knr4/Smi1-like domain-containing protein n=2 Tax=Pseudoduganella rivuli TaxID=2666085 RepID=A0A7X2ITT2_9BURK|nr:hypothetical protein [Pseudoduganella rivuli]